MNTYTNGPWKVIRHETAKTYRYQVWQDKDDQPRMLPYKIADSVTFKDDAHLMAAAPEMLKALETLIDACTVEVAPDGYRMLKMPSQAAMRNALAAIAKATGGEA